MKTNEFIGTCVYFNCFDGNEIIVRVTGFKDGIVYGDSENGSHWCNIEKVKPIPLTAEILEKNLATEPQIAWCVGWNKKDDIHVEIKREDLNAAFYGVIYFVHQLQHSLRLCGIEKEIVI